MTREQVSIVVAVGALALSHGCGAPAATRPSPDNPPRWSASSRTAIAPGREGPRVVEEVVGRRMSSGTIPGGVTCLLRLSQLGIPHRVLQRGRLRHVQTPVRITGEVGGVRYRPLYRRQLVCDCRLALTLLRAAPLLRELGVRELQFSSAHRRNGRRDRISRHAMGLALDVHHVVDRAGRRHTVLTDYQRGLADGCEPAHPLLNRVSCLLKRYRIFDRVLTPDTNAAHHNHFHFAILSLERRRYRRTRRPSPVIHD